MIPQIFKIGLLPLAIMNMIVIFDLTGIASQAEYGLSAIFYYLVAAIFFLIPICFVAAELGSTYPNAGGVFRWVGQAFGPRWGFVAIFLQWINAPIFFPTTLAFAWVAISFILPNINIDSKLAQNSTYALIAILSIFWLAIYATMRGFKNSTKTTIVLGVIGTLIPAAILIFFGFLYFIQGNPIQISVGWRELIPKMSGLTSLVLAAAIFLDYAGMEVSSVHIERIKNPQKTYSLAILISTFFIVCFFILTTLPISFVIPAAKINLTESLLMTFDSLLRFYGMPWAGSIISALLVFGIIGQLVVWLGGPSVAMLSVGRSGFLPPIFHKVNSHGAPQNILLFLGLVVSVLTIIFKILPSIEAVFQILTQLACLLYLIVYMMMFGACIYLRYALPNIERPFKIPGGEIGLWVCNGVGLLSSFFGFYISLIPPSQIPVGNPATYVAILVIGVIAFIAIPLVLYALRKPSWVMEKNEHPFQAFIKLDD
jgi:putative glutamate/gamma-aminobutyrate antiporter